MLIKLKKCLGVIKRPIVKFYKCIVLLFFSKNKKDGIVNVGFIVQMPSIWDKQIDVYNELKQKDNVNVKMFVVPEYDFENDKILDNYNGNYFLSHYKDSIKVLDEDNKYIDLSKYHLDYIFYPRPYEYYLPQEIRSNKLFKRIKCCYIPYDGLCGSDLFDYTDLKFYDNMYCCFVDSENQKKQLIDHYRISYNLGIKKIYSFGSPVLARFINCEQFKKIKTIAWTPRWSNDPVIGCSNFTKYCNDFLKMIKNNKYKYIFRPHPLMFDELIKKGYISHEYKDYFLLELSKYSVTYDINCPIEHLLKETDLLITDFSSIIPQFFVMNRPIIYCDNTIKLNEDFECMMRFSYKANDWNEILMIIDKIENSGDMYINGRKEYIKSSMLLSENIPSKIADIISSNI